MLLMEMPNEHEFLFFFVAQCLYFSCIQKLMGNAKVLRVLGPSNR